MTRVNPVIAFGAASNIRDGDNPPYTVEDFRAIMPGFSEEIISTPQLQHIVDMAHSVVKEARWHGMWKEGMRLYIAHFATLFIGTPQEGASRAEMQNAGKVPGAITNKTVGPVSVGYDVSQATSDLTGWAAFKLTSYGTQFATLAKLYGKGGMFVR